MKHFLVFLLMLCSLLNCTATDNTEINKNDYIIFGHFHGKCVGKSCIENYKLTSDTLYEDLKNDYSHTEYEFVALNNDTFNQVKNLLDFFPSKLLNEKESVLGCPDCADQGGIYIELSKEGVVKSWRIDSQKEAVPSYLHNFMDKVNEKIVLINK